MSKKSLAMMVEDHPLDYRTFEGTIPAGNYGAGTVMVWDQGTYHAAETSDGGESERVLRDGLNRGRLSFVLEGEKLHGEFSLVKLKRGAENAWLLIKKHDEWATEGDVAAQDRSVQSGRELDEIAAGRKGRRKATKPAKVQLIKPKKVPAATAGVKVNTADAPKGSMPRKVKPMLATLVDEPFDRDGWLYEVKWDGFRAIAAVDKTGVEFYSRNFKSFAERFTPLVESLRRLNRPAVLDGEVVVLDKEGKSQFHLLQNYQKTGVGTLGYYVFDLLYLDGRDLRGLPLVRRKEMLAKVIDGLPNVLLSEHVENDGVAFFEAAEKAGLEGIMAKDGASPYREGIRSHSWLKIKTHRRQEAVICGFTEPRGTRKDLGALVLGVYEGKELVYVGHTGGGLDTRGLADLRARLEPLEQRSSPIHPPPRTNAPVHWVAPRLVCEVRFQQWTQDGVMRMPIFLGLREDKPPHSVHRESPEELDQALKKKAKEPHARAMAPASRNGKAGKRTRAKSASAAEPKLSNLDKVYWPGDGYAKGDLIDYYRAMASVMLPYLRDRPQSLHRHPNGITGSSFFQKDMSKQPPPDWVETVDVPSESQGKVLKYALCQDEASLLYLANLGCIEINPWNSRVGSLDRPDYVVIDLDPEDIAFERVVEAAIAVHKTLKGCGASSYCKTSGKRGLHIFVPLGAQYDYEQAKQFAEIVANVVHRQLPKTTSVVRSPAQRQKRVYLDFLQNRRGQTLAAPYSVRPTTGATVSTPLKWTEVKKGLDPARFTIKTMAKRLDAVGDLWKPVIGRGIDLEACLGRIHSS